MIYWYRTAPGLRLGRPALDDGAMRTLEEQYPDIDFDWPYILDMASMTPVEVEGPVPVRKRKPRRDDDDDSDAAAEPGAAARPSPPSPPVAVADPPAAALRAADTRAGEFDLLGELMGRGIATSLRANHRDLLAELEASPAAPVLKAAWRDRLAAIDPDGWTSPDDVLAGMASVERDGEDLRRAIEAASAAS